MASNGNTREKAIDALIHNLTEGRASRDFDRSKIEEGLRDLSIELREDNGCYRGYLRTDDGQERWLSWGEVEDNLRILYGLIPEKAISGDAETSDGPLRMEQPIPSVIVLPPSAERAGEDLEGKLSAGNTVPDRMAADGARDKIETRVAVPLPEVGSVSRQTAPLNEPFFSKMDPNPIPPPADELPADVETRIEAKEFDGAEETLVKKQERRRLGYLIAGVSLGSLLLAGISATTAYFIGRFEGRYEAKPAACPTERGGEEKTEINWIKRDNQDLSGRLTDAKEKLKHADKDNNYLAQRMVRAEEDYVEYFEDLSDISVTFAENNSVLEQTKKENKDLTAQITYFSTELDAALTDLSAFELELDGIASEVSATGKRLGKCIEERGYCTTSWENEQALALTYIADRDAAVAERDGTILEMGDCLAREQNIYADAEVCAQREKSKDEQLSVCTAKEGEWIKKDDAYQTTISEKEKELAEVRGSLEGKIADYSALESSHQQELEKKQGELAQLQGQLARVQEQLKITEESNSSYSTEKSKSGSDLTDCKAEQERIQTELSKISGLLEGKTREYDSLVFSFGEERKKAQEKLAQAEEQIAKTEEQLKTEREQSNKYLAERDEKENTAGECGADLVRSLDQAGEAESKLETCVNERDQALAVRVKTKNLLDDCVESIVMDVWSVLSTDGKAEVCYADENSQYDSGNIVAGSLTCVPTEQFSMDYSTLIPKMVSLTKRGGIVVAAEHKPEVGPRRAESYVHKLAEQDVPLREENYYEQLRADPTQSVKMAVAFAKEQGDSITVCGNGCEEKQISLFEQIAPEGMDDAYTLGLFVNFTSDFCRGMTEQTPYCVPLTLRKK